MASVYKPSPHARKYRIAYINELGQRVNVSGYRDKQASLAKARQLERDAERARAGLPVANSGQRSKPLHETIDLYLIDLVRRGTAENTDHYKETRRILYRLEKDCGWKNLSAIRAEDLTQFLGELASRGRSPRTLNSYHEILDWFLNWCVRQSWLEESPIRRLQKAKVGEAGRRCRRRPFQDDEWKAFIQAAGVRRTIYEVAAFSGFRRSELARMQKRDCQPLGPNPVWTVRPEVAKNRKSSNLPMTDACAQALGPLWSSLPRPDSSIFPSVPAMITFYRDLSRAGIPKYDANQRKLDFHSLRYTFCRWMSQLLPIEVVKLLMRHSTIQLTVDLYGQLGFQDLGIQVWALPPLFPAKDPPPPPSPPKDPPPPP